MLNRKGSVISVFNHEDSVIEDTPEEEEADEEELSCTPPRTFKRKLFQGQPKYGTPPGLVVNHLRSLHSVHAIEINELFTEKLEQCCARVDFFKTPEAEIKDHSKTETLIELVDWLKNGDFPSVELVYSTAMSMAQINLIRYFPGSDSIDCHYCVDVKMYEAAWFHLSLVYDILLLLLNSKELNEKIVTNCLSSKLVCELISMFDSLDSREREKVKKLVHLIYLKLRGFRQLIRFQLYYVLLRFIHETDKYNGVAEILEVLSCIISGFITPLKQEQTILFNKILLPLHKAHCLHGFHGQLMYCMAQYIEKDQSLFQVLFRTLVKYWPRQCVPKQAMFLSEIDELIYVIQPEIFEKSFSDILGLIGRSLNSEHFQVTERGLHLLNNDRVNGFITGNHMIAYVFPYLYHLMTQHWSRPVKTLTHRILARYKSLDEDLFDDMTYYVMSGGRVRPKPIEEIPYEELGELPWLAKGEDEEEEENNEKTPF